MSIERHQISAETAEAIVSEIEMLPSFNQKSAYDMGARDMKSAIIKTVRGMVKK